MHRQVEHEYLKDRRVIINADKKYTKTCNRQEKANAGNVKQKIHPSLKQSTLIHTQTHTYLKSYINSLKIHIRHTLNKGENKGTASARSVVVIYYWGLNWFV